MKKVLIVVAHPDDETLGCGGALYRHSREGEQVFCLVLSEGESSRSRSDIQRRKEQFYQAAEVLGIKDFKLLNFQDNTMDSGPLLNVIKEIEAYKEVVNPDIVYTHHGSDLNIDHQIVYQAVLTAFRGMPGEYAAQVLTFQSPSSSEWSDHASRASFAPNYWVELDRECVNKKIQALKCYKEEIREFPHPRSEDILLSRMKVSGSKAGCFYAEEFFSERIIRKID